MNPDNPNNYFGLEIRKKHGNTILKRITLKDVDVKKPRLNSINIIEKAIKYDSLRHSTEKLDVGSRGL